MTKIAKWAGAALFGAALGGVAGQAAAEPKYGTAAFFYDHCKAALDNNNSKELYRQGECAGLLGSLSYMSEQLPSEYKFCSPADATAAQLIRVLVAHMDKNKAQLEKTHVIIMALAAFRQEWPCRS